VGPALAALTFAAVLLALLLIPANDPGLATFWERTVVNQLDRESPFSVWGQLEWPEWPQRVVLAAAGLLALAVAFVPARRTLGQSAALAASTTGSTSTSPGSADSCSRHSPASTACIAPRSRGSVVTKSTGGREETR
jgi:hypothetical protein